jgi:hypothetical protein
MHFDHEMAAHCESGSITALMNHAGVDISEPLVFGVSGAIFFGYFHTAMFPFPTFVLRNRPGKIRSKCAQRLGIKFTTSKFRDPPTAMEALDDLLARNVPVGVQVDFFYMDYIPEYARAHFNAHYIVVVGKEDNEYLISDSYSPDLALLPGKTLEKARFVKGPLSPRGLMFYPLHVPAEIDFPSAVRKGIKDAAFNMLRIPIPFLGVRGIRRFAKKLVDWPKHARDTEHLSHQLMMINVILEERGTGGGGFRFLYASFLQKASEILDNPELADMAEAMMNNGDRWRELSLFAARLGKRLDVGPERLRELSEMLMGRADEEERLFTQLRKMV